MQKELRWKRFIMAKSPRRRILARECRYSNVSIGERKAFTTKVTKVHEGKRCRLLSRPVEFEAREIHVGREGHSTRTTQRCTKEGIRNSALEAASYFVCASGRMEINLGRFRFHRLFLVALLVVLGGVTTWAQDLVRAPRQDGRQTPLRVYAREGQGCEPVALISPGAGGSEDGYKYLAKGMRDDGWRAIVLGHKESGGAALWSDMREAGGIKSGLQQLVNDPKAYDARLMDIAAALKWAESSCKAPFVALLGHSMGARTVMVEAGSKNTLGVKGLDRFDAYVALSPDGPGPMFPENAWSGIRKPVLMLTGTRDQSLDGDWRTRTIPYDSLPTGCKWLGVIDGATHMNFAGVGFSGSTEKLTLLETKAFLDGLRGGKCGAPVAAEGIIVKSK